jgi:serine/threonine protein kinase
MRSWALGPGDALTPDRRVVRRLGGGVAHEVFLVEIGRSRRAVAKLPRPHLADDVHCLASLSHEGRALDRLAHTAFPRHLDTVMSSPHPHLLLEHIPGPTLLCAVRAGEPLDPALVATLGAALADGLAHLARAGWVHLDVKPSNIVLNVAPRLLDFELARPAAAAARMLQPIGTWHYMPPEQRAAAAAARRLIGPPTDVFALALSLGEALLGRPIERDPEPEPLPGPVGAALAEAMAAWPGDRPTAAELADVLMALGEPAPGLRPAA